MEPSISIDGDRARLPSSVFEHAGFRAWARSGDVPDWLHIAFIDGEVLIEMSPEAIETHNKAKRKLTEVLGRIVDDEDLGEAYADGALVTNEDARLSTEPDFTFVSWSTFEAGRARLVEKANRKDDHIEIEGSPDLVLEVVSDSSVRKDTQLLFDAYLRAGVSEYWLVDARAELSFQIFHLSDGVYRASAPANEPQHSSVLGRTFELTRAKNRAGRWRYGLDVRDALRSI
ncbi:MAG TPA: Uma2 family endonuclease [Kofleriaceae bacterium]|nr:Uma2 family endonuclease [Kofleriaceae bacterium]